MVAFISIVLVCGLLLQTVMASPRSSLESMTYQVRMIDPLEEFSLLGTTYFSVKHEAYRFDFSGGMSKLFIYPKKGRAVYYYPISNFQNNKFNITKCATFEVPTLSHLISPLPSVKGYRNLGPDDLYGTIADRYVKVDEEYGPQGTRTEYVENGPEGIKTEDVENETQGTKTEDVIWMKKQANSSIDHLPVTGVHKEWIISGNNGYKQQLTGHIITEYFDFLIGEQDSSVWEPPQMSCHADDDPAIVFLAADLSVRPELLGHGLAAIRKKPYHRSGKVPTRIVPDFGLKLPFPYSPEQYKSLAKTLPKAFDWRYFGAVTDVKAQRNCGSCWAFGTVGSLEGAYFLKHKRLVELSVQALVDCAGSSVAYGCFGGWETSGYAWINHTGGIPPAEEYGPYQETNGNCRVNDQTPLVAQLMGFYQVPESSDALKVALVKLGPIAITIDSSSFTLDYQNGILAGTECDPSYIDHSVLLVGYGESAEDGSYWIIKNSWSTFWGLEGYALLSAKGENPFCISSNAYIPVLK